MKKIPLVSVIIPAYNAAKYLSCTIESVIRQDYQNIEIIVIDDGSKDNTSEVAAQYSDKIAFITQNNSGATVARNRGLSEANGKYIQFLDADDLLSADKIGAQVELLEKNDGYVSFCETRHFFDGDDYFQTFNQDLGPSIYFNEGKIDPAGFLWHLWGGISPNIAGMVQSNAWLTPRKVIDKAGVWDTSLPNNPDDDGEFFCRVILSSKGIIFSKYGINYYRKFRGRSVSLSSRSDYAALKSILKSIDSKAKNLLAHSSDEKSYKAIAHQYTSLYYATYPFPWKVYREAKLKMLKYGGPTIGYEPGGKFFRSLLPYFNWKIIKIFQLIKKKLLYS